MHISDHLRGILLTTAGVVILSPDAILIRFLKADTLTVIFWRGIVFAIGIVILMLLLYRKDTVKQFIKVGKSGLLIGFVFGLSTLCFTYAIQNTSISNTLVIYSTSPMFAALFSWVFLKEKIKLITWVAMFIITGAIMAIMSNSLGSTGFLGDIGALGTSIFSAISFTITRRYKEVNMIPAMAISGLVVVIIVIPFITITGTTLLLLPSVIPYLILGGITVTIAFALITLGPRYMPAPEVALILPLETVLGSYLGWIFLKEEPTILTIFGGIVVIATLCIHAWLSLQND